MKSYLNRLFLLFVMLSTGNILAANDVSFQYITSEDGLSQSEIYTFLQDSRGFMWFGTLDGLNRFDGYNIDKFNTDRINGNSLINNTIRSLAEDNCGRVWIGTDYGLNYYDPITDAICQIKTSFDQSAVWSIYIEGDTILVGLPSGLWLATLPEVIDEGTQVQFSQVEIVSNEFQSNAVVKDIVKCQRGGLWIVTTWQVCRVVFNNSAGKYLLADVINHDLLPQEFSGINSAVETNNGDLWIVSEISGLAIYDVSKHSVRWIKEYGTKHALSSRKCSSIVMDHAGNIWIGTLDSGLNRAIESEIDKEDIHFEQINYQYTNPHSLNSNLIYSLYCTANNQLWVGTIGSGINIYDPSVKKFAHYRVAGIDQALVNSNFVRSVLVDANDDVFIGTHANGLIKFDVSANRYKKLGFDRSSVFNMVDCGAGRYIVCTSVGLRLVEIKGDKVRVLDKCFEESCFYVVKGKGDSYWVATFNGLMRVEVRNDRIKLVGCYDEQSTPALSRNVCRVLYYDRFMDVLYVGTEGGGLNILTLDHDHNVSSCKILKSGAGQYDLSSNYIRSITPDHNDNIWIGTYEGLNRLIVDPKSDDGYSFISYTTQDGLPNNMIQSITEDFDNKLWIGTNGGLSHFDSESGKFVNFSISDGIQSNEFSEHTSLRKTNGEIILGGINGLTIFDPKEICDSPNKPNTTITRLLLSNAVAAVGAEDSPLSKNMILTDSITLQPHQTNLGFEFSAMLYPNPSNIKYAYKLEGFDTEWHTLEPKNHVVNYTNLRHGNYTFMVSSTNEDGVWENGSKRVYVHIKAPIYVTWWAKLLYFIVAFGVFLYIMRLYLARKRLLMLRNHAKKVHELDNMRTRFFINISHDLRTPLTLIREPLSMLIDEESLAPSIKSKLQLIMRNVKRLNYLVEQLLDTRKAEMGGLRANLVNEDIVAFVKDELNYFSYAASQKGLAINVEAAADTIFVSFDRNMISKVIFNIVSNALKYTSRGAITVKISRSTDHRVASAVCVSVCDTGVGMSSELAKKAFDRFYQGAKAHEKGYGIGLSHTKELIDAHQGSIDIESCEGLGTTVTFTIPDVAATLQESKSKDSSYEDLYIEQDYVESKIELREDAKTILIVEDNADMRNFMTEEIGRYYNVVTAKDGVEGFHKAIESKPDIIISDLLMPNLDGMGMHERIKANADTKHAIFIFISAKDDMDTKYKGIEHGADDYLTKPFDMKYLLLRIDNLLKSRDRMRLLYESKQEFVRQDVNISSSDDLFIKELFEHINKGISNPDFSISSLESIMSMSHTNFYRKIKTLTGQSGQELLFNMRMKLAHKLLMENDAIRVSEVAYHVGFTNPKYFSKRFKEIYGVAPNSLHK